MKIPCLFLLLFIVICPAYSQQGGDLVNTVWSGKSPYEGTDATVTIHFEAERLLFSGKTDNYLKYKKFRDGYRVTIAKKKALFIKLIDGDSMEVRMGKTGEPSLFRRTSDSTETPSPVPAAKKQEGSRTWTALSGHTIDAVAIGVKSGQAGLQRPDGTVVPISLQQLILEDVIYLFDHFRLDQQWGSQVPAAIGSKYPMGKVSGPVKTPEGSGYFVYLPKSLKEGRKAPLMHYTHAGGGSAKLLQEITESADVCGWILAISVESKNAGSNESNLEHNRNCVSHLLSTLPVDEDRVYFMGNSGGGATSYINSEAMKTAGVMPNVAYIPHGVEPGGKDFFIIGGGQDYNRYLSAGANQRLGSKAVHRMHPGGHGVSPDWLMNDGIIWLQSRYLQRNKSDHAKEASDFEVALTRWILEKRKKSPYRAYATAKLLLDEFQMEGPATQLVNSITGELSANPKNVAYYEGLSEMDSFSEKELSKYDNHGSLKNHIDKDISRKASALANKYSGVPVIEDVFKAIAEKTVASGKN